MALARGLAAQVDRWRPLVRFDAGSRHYARLVSGPDLEAWVLTWLPGQATEWHDHGGSAGAFLILEGTLSEQVGIPGPDGTSRIGDGVRSLPVGAARGFGPRHLHRVANRGPGPAVSLHVYAPILSAMNAYRADGEILRQVRTERAGADW